MRFSLFAVMVALAASMSANACSGEGGHCITQADCCEDDNLYLVCEINVSMNGLIHIQRSAHLPSLIDWRVHCA
jgi:hypothetical protein